MAQWVTAEVRQLAEKDPGRTADDYLLRTGRVETPSDWNRAKTSLRRALAEGGALYDLVLRGDIRATESEKTRARPGGWTEKAQVAQSVEVKDLRTAGSSRMLKTIDQVNGGVSKETQQHLVSIADLSHRSITERRFEAIAEHIDGIVEREAITALKLEHEREKGELKQQMIDQLQRDYDILVEIVRSRGDEVVPQRRADRGDKNE